MKTRTLSIARPSPESPPQNVVEALFLIGRDGPLSDQTRQACALLIRDALTLAGEKTEALERALEELRRQAGAYRTALGRLKEARRTSRQAFDRHLGVFEKFRAAIEVCQRMKSLEELPGLLSRLKGILSAPFLELLLSREDFGEFAPEGLCALPEESIVRELRRLPPNAALSPKEPLRPYLGPTRDVPGAAFFLGGAGDGLMAGSCFIRPVHDKYRPNRLIGALVFADPSPERYAPEKATHFLELFCETLAGAALDVKNHDKIVRESVRDELTGAHNRTYFNRHAPRLLQFAERKNLPVSLLFIDLDRFKAVNDALGHEAGDRVLTAAAKRLGGITRKYDLFARLGGDEFVILSPDATAEDAAALAARIRREIEDLPIGSICGVDVGLTISASVGAAMWEPGMSADELIRLADERMYADKRGEPA